jgi:hypothetical protein
MEIEAGFDLFSGPANSFFGGYGRNDRGYVKVRYLF